jgi:hypothetical protein
MHYDHEAIREAYPDELLEIVDDKGIFKANTSCTEIFSVDQSKVDAARVELNKLNYIYDRVSGTTKYASFGDQLDMLYKDMLAGKLDTTGTWATHIKAVKDANPKP